MYMYEQMNNMTELWSVCTILFADVIDSCSCCAAIVADKDLCMCTGCGKTK